MKIRQRNEMMLLLQHGYYMSICYYGSRMDLQKRLIQWVLVRLNVCAPLNWAYGQLCTFYMSQIDCYVYSAPMIPFFFKNKALSSLQFVCVESLVTAVVDMYPETFRRGYRREWLILGMSIVSFFIGLIMCTEVSLSYSHIIRDKGTTDVKDVCVEQFCSGGPVLFLALF